MKTFPLLATLALWAGLTVVAASQDQKRPDQKDQKGPEKQAPDSKAQEILARVSRNMESAEDRLKKSDPGDVTRKIQRDIVDDLDELIKQSKQQQQGGGGGGKADKFTKSSKKSSSKQSGQDKQDSANNQQNDMKENGRAKPAPGEKDQGKDKNKGKGDEKEGDGKTGGKDDGKDTAKGEAKAKEDGSQGGLGSAKKDTSSKTDLLADQHRAEWGHLPLTKRQEMDAYAKQRFMPRYDEALQEYYRTVSQQAQKKN
jgi:hypothetical protein